MVTFMCYVPEEPLAIASNLAGMGKMVKELELPTNKSLCLRHRKANRKSHMAFDGYQFR